ncbi:CU044_5270 family protein [Actinophytocola algeriensis]|uniref:CU044_5270 family protein n=1 Tax=Actinophytocola algeriensis TaxID=1768010 RepID=A0A7W7Q3C8_9PSEU|nr:CU044_5270 family protein [Actinophytocola algeriensis]MBB4906078.1 hypothetical protein [Actinophytocola algeriensis]MBE1472237.1 hypothetical protein [Actinophytocola algeriensis]
MTDRDPLDELISDLRTDVPELSDEAFAASRARLQTLIEAVPVTTGPQPDAAVVPLPRKRLLRSPPRRLITSAAAAVVLAAGVLFVQAVRSDSPAPAASAAATLNSAADNINPVDEPIEPGQYRYIASHSRGLGHHLTAHADGDDTGPFIALDEWTHEEWVPADLAQQCVARSHATGREWVVGDEERAKAAGIEPLSTEVHEEVKPCTGSGDWSRYPSAEFLESVTRDPRQLYDLLRRKPMPVAMSDASWVMNRVGATLTSGRAPADLRAALYRALALLPGLEVTERVANLDGHQGTALGLTEYGVRHDLIIDPATGQYIGERTVHVSDDSDLPPGTIVSYTSVSNPVVVDAVGATR